jgi:membrane-associated phospholipid phosphatase
MFHGRMLAAALATAFAWAQDAPAPGVEIDRFPQLPGLVAGDLKAAATAPAAWSAPQWGEVGLGAAALVGVSMALDRPVDKAAQRLNRTRWDPWAKRLDTLGGTGTVIIAGGAYLGGLVSNQPAVREFGSDASLSMAVAQLLVTLPGKYLAGRSRPDAGAGPYHFKPMNGGDSFPSGHATQAFSLAAVVADYADNPWASAAAYGGATLVGLARLEQRVHFVSDVCAGALIGIGSARFVLKRHQILRANQLEVDLEPVWTPGRTELRVSLKF